MRNKFLATTSLVFAAALAFSAPANANGVGTTVDEALREHVCRAGMGRWRCAGYGSHIFWPRFRNGGDPPSAASRGAVEESSLQVIATSKK